MFKMAFKAVVFCAFALMVQSIAGQTCYQPQSCGCQSISVSNNGGPLVVTSVGPISPSGIAVATDLGLAGNLDVSGSLPYLSAVEFQGQFDTSGTAPVSYGCGDCVAITQQIGGSGNGLASYGGAGNSLASYGGCGCGR